MSNDKVKWATSEATRVHNLVNRAAHQELAITKSQFFTFDGRGQVIDTVGIKPISGASQDAGSAGMAMEVKTYE